MNDKNQEIPNILNNFESLIASMPGYVYWKDKNGIYLGCNDAQAKFSGFESREQLIGKTIHEILPKELADIVKAHDEEIMLSGKEQAIEETLPDGRIVISNKIPLKNSSGKVVGLLGISTDVTELKKKHAALEKVQDRTQLTLDNIVANMPGHVFWMNRKGVYLGCNKLQAKSVGLESPEQFIGKTPFELQPKDEAEKLFQVNQSVMASGKPIVVEEECSYPDGNKGIFLSRKIPLKDNNDNIVGLLGIAFDITAEKEAEQLRAEKLAVEESLKAAQLMAASIAHEMRTPLGTIAAVSGNLEVFMPTVFEGYEIAKAEAKVEEPLSRKTVQYLKEAPELLKKVVSGANTFINMMLMKFNPDNIKAEKLIKLSMAKAVKDAVQIYPMTESERALIKINMEDDFEFMGDKTLFDHIIFNLLKNALYYIKAAQKGKVEISLEPGLNKNIVHFKDTGKGMAPEVVKNLFDNFYSQTRHGTGVGLALCKMIMHEFKGEISCESVEGEYTHFKLIFPK